MSQRDFFRFWSLKMACFICAERHSDHMLWVQSKNIQTCLNLQSYYLIDWLIIVYPCSIPWNSFLNFSIDLILLKIKLSSHIQILELQYDTVNGQKQNIWILNILNIYICGDIHGCATRSFYQFLPELNTNKMTVFHVRIYRRTWISLRGLIKLYPSIYPSIPCTCDEELEGLLWDKGFTPDRSTASHGADMHKHIILTPIPAV